MTMALRRAVLPASSGVHDGPCKAVTPPSLPVIQELSDGAPCEGRTTVIILTANYRIKGCIDLPGRG
jgi:hypothetical protein